MPTNTFASRPTARLLPWQALHYLRRTVNYNDSTIAAGEQFQGDLPAGASLHYVLVKIKTTFNGGTNTLTVGQNAGINDMVAAGDVDPTVAQAYMVLRGSDLTFPNDTNPSIKYVQTGAAATQGQAEVTLVFAPNNDA